MSIRKDTAGFTLIEVMIAMAIMIIGLLAFWKMHITSVNSDSFSNQMTKAIFYANQKMEELRAEDFDSITSGSSTITDVIEYRMRWNVNEYSTELNDVKKIDIIVGWLGDQCRTDINKCSHKVSFTTFVYNLK